VGLAPGSPWVTLRYGSSTVMAIIGRATCAGGGGGGLIGGMCHDLLTAVEFNPRAQGASRGAKETTVQGIEERLTMELGLRTPAVG
jgi:hypothetical protein